ncbi:MAG: hypothetical protein E7260_06775 [Lachnospiraceae bacterium]|nr:hypothetical protein [Lachnospiraceae bacterium]
MVELFERDIKTADRKSSKGNQLKWENIGLWYKADYTGYEGLTEYVISHLLKKSTLSAEEYVLYDLEEIKYNEVIYKGVKSRDFLEDDWQLITLERLFQNFFGESLHKAIYRTENHEERLHFLVNQAERITGLKEFGKYMNKLFTIDAFFLNEDRHTHNIAVLMNGVGEFKYCPIFDNGAGLLADTTMDYPLSGEVGHMVQRVQAKTICQDFEEQLEVSERLYGGNLKFSFSKKDIKAILDGAAIYSAAERDRVEEILYAQMRKYRYLFIGESL